MLLKGPQRNAKRRASASVAQQMLRATCSG
jgi:hypothetical protein